MSNNLPRPDVEVTKEEWEDWLRHPFTRALRWVVAERVEQIKNDWLYTNYTAENEFGTRFLNGQANGAAKAMEEVLSFNHETVNGEIRNE